MSENLALYFSILIAYVVIFILIVNIADLRKQVKTLKSEIDRYKAPIVTGRINESQWVQGPGFTPAPPFVSPHPVRGTPEGAPSFRSNSFDDQLPLRGTAK